MHPKKMTSLSINFFRHLETLEKFLENFKKATFKSFKSEKLSQIYIPDANI